MKKKEYKDTYPPEFLDALKVDLAKRFDPVEHQRIQEVFGLANPTNKSGVEE